MRVDNGIPDYCLRRRGSRGSFRGRVGSGDPNEELFGIPIEE